MRWNNHEEIEKRREENRSLKKYKNIINKLKKFMKKIELIAK